MSYVLGLDLSLTQTGWATVDPCGTLYGTAPTKPGDLGERLATIRACVLARARSAPCKLAVVEQPFSGRGGTTGAQVYGVIILALHDCGVPVAVVPPATLKVYACGSGSGGKLAPALSAAKRLGYEGTNDNEVDALWLATLGWHLLGRPVVELPMSHTRALSGKWAKEWPGYVVPVPKVRKASAA